MFRLSAVSIKRKSDLNWQKPKPLLRWRDSIGIGGRYDNHGIESEPLLDSELSELKTELAKHSDGDVAVAICCLFSYLTAATRTGSRKLYGSRFPMPPFQCRMKSPPYGVNTSALARRLPTRS